MKDASAVFARHRGPYVFYVVRPRANKPGYSTGEWLRGNVEEPIEEALALLTDPRDTITSVSVYSMVEDQFVTALTPRYFSEVE